MPSVKDQAVVDEAKRVMGRDWRRDDDMEPMLRSETRDGHVFVLEDAANGDLTFTVICRGGNFDYFRGSVTGRSVEWCANEFITDNSRHIRIDGFFDGGVGGYPKAALCVARCLISALKQDRKSINA